MMRARRWEQPLVEDRVLFQPLVYLGPNRMLHDRGPGLGMGQVGYLLLEVLVQDGDRLHHFADFGADALVDELLDLGADVGPVHVGVLAEEVGADVGADQREPGQPVDVGQGARVGLLPVHQPGELAIVGVEPLEHVGLEVALGAGVGRDDHDARPDVAKLQPLEVGLGPDGHDFDDRRWLLLQHRHGVLHFGPLEAGQCLLQVMGYAAVVHHKAVGLLGRGAVLFVGETAVDAGNSLQQPMLAQRTIQVEHLLQRRVEATEEHVDHHQHLRLAVRIFEIVGDLPLVQFPCDLELGAVVVAGGDDEVSAHAAAPQLFGVAEGGGPAGSDHLRLEPVGTHLSLKCWAMSRAIIWMRRSASATVSR